MKALARRHIISGLLLLAVGVGATSGYLSPPIEAASQGELWVYPGDQSSGWAYMTCGWHIECTNYTPGDGIDWGNQGGWPTVWRAWAYRAGSYGYFGLVVPSYVPSSCKGVNAQFYDQNGVYRGYTRYTHTESPGAYFYVYADPDWEAWAVTISTTSSSELTGCPWTGAHLHQQSSGTGWVKNTGLPNAPGAGWYQTWVDWMHYRTW